MKRNKNIIAWGLNEDFRDRIFLVVGKNNVGYLLVKGLLVEFRCEE